MKSNRLIILLLLFKAGLSHSAVAYYYFHFKLHICKLFESNFLNCNFKIFRRAFFDFSKDKYILNFIRLYKCYVIELVIKMFLPYCSKNILIARETECPEMVAILRYQDI